MDVSGGDPYICDPCTVTDCTNCSNTVGKCKDGGCSWFALDTGGGCSPKATCDDTCATCYGGTANDCLTCHTGEMLSSKGNCSYIGDCHYLCYGGAPNNYSVFTESGGTNQHCTGSTINDCLTCREGWNHPTDNSSEACDPCVPNCRECTAYTSDDCDDWFPGFFGQQPTGRTYIIYISYLHC